MLLVWLVERGVRDDDELTTKIEAQQIHARKRFPYTSVLLPRGHANPDGRFPAGAVYVTDHEGDKVVKHIAACARFPSDLKIEKRARSPADPTGTGAIAAAAGRGLVKRGAWVETAIETIRWCM